jgi:uncharacterized OB-fold protein
MSDKPVPEISEVAKPYWEAARNDELHIQRCTGCGKAIFYPRHWCPHCLGQEISWERASGLGRIHSYSTVYQAPFEAFAADAPYVLALVELAEGPVMMANVLNCDPEGVSVGMPVKVCFEERADGFKVPQFEPADA